MVYSGRCTQLSLYLLRRPGIKYLIGNGQWAIENRQYSIHNSQYALILVRAALKKFPQGIPLRLNEEQAIQHLTFTIHHFNSAFAFTWRLCENFAAWREPLFPFKFSLFNFYFYQKKLLPFSLTSRITKKDFIWCSFLETYRRPPFIMIGIFGLAMFVSGLLEVAGLISFHRSSVYSALFGGLFVVLIPLLLAWLTSVQLKSNPAMLKDMKYTFREDGYSVAGDTFSTDISWRHIIRQRESGKYIILYHNSNLGNFIDKTKMTAEQLAFVKGKVAGK